MKIIAIIPARMASIRFHGKPLADIHGLPMIEHVRRRVALCASFDEVIVATCDREIFDVIINNGGKAVMTRDTHERCTDRIAEAALSADADIIVNVQGDEPMVRPEMFQPLLSPLIDEPELVCTNLMNEITDSVEFNSANIVKIVCDLKGNAIYFSREPIPSVRKAGGLAYRRYKQLGIIAFHRDFLHLFPTLTPTPHEIIESVDMLRAVEYGYKVRMVLTPYQIVGVDIPSDIERVIKLMKNDDLMHSYING